MKLIIKKILKEDFDWIRDIPGAPDGITIGEPLTQSNPKNMFRLMFSHGHGEDGADWVENWTMIRPEDGDRLVWLVKLLRVLEGRDGIWSLISRIVDDGEHWIIEPMVRNASWWSVEDYDNEDVVYETLREGLQDIGLVSYNSYYDEDAEIEDYKLRYFDRFGVEHKVNIDSSKFR